MTNRVAPIRQEVWEFLLAPDQAVQTLHMPAPAKALAVAYQPYLGIRLFMLVTRSIDQMHPRSFRVVSTGVPIEGEYTYIGTVSDGQDHHVFEVMAPSDSGEHLAANGKPIDGYPRQQA